MKSLRRRLALFSFLLVSWCYFRRFDQEQRLMLWSVVTGLAAAFMLTFMGPGKGRRWLG